jgi:hypothetical protein
MNGYARTPKSTAACTHELLCANPSVKRTACTPELLPTEEIVDALREPKARLRL